MAIDLSRYIQITSGVGAGANVGTRQLNGMLITDNPLVPTSTFLSFDSADEVLDYFGSDSEEYDRAVFYFGWISKNITAPQSLNFWFWNEDADTASLVYGNTSTKSLATFQAISTGDFTMELGGYSSHVTGINCSAASSLSAVATIVQTAIRAVTSGGAAWTGATVSYDSTRGSFNLESGDTGADVIEITAGSVTDIASPLGWLTGAILSNGSDAQAVEEMLAELNNTNNNFGSFAFVPTLSQDDIVSAAEWNDSLPSNIQYMYTLPVSASNASAISAALVDIGGCTATLSPLADEYPEMVPMMILSATDYTRRNSTQNYMFQQFSLTASVTTDTDADTYDDLRVNYYGQTQTAGQQLAFYQRGFMFGLATDPSDQNIYANEIWFKAACSSQLMTLLLSLAKISANSTGKSQIMAILQSVIDTALFNGTISVGKPLSTTQKLYITNATGDANAWQQVQSLGYWVDCVIESYVENDVTQWKAVYTIIYSKDDVIRKIEGTDILI